MMDPQMAAHPSINWAQRRATTLIKTNMLPLSQANIKKQHILPEE